MARVCLCVNQIARIRSLNKSTQPDPVAIAIAAEIAGVDGIVALLHEDRSDITDRDVTVLKEVVHSHLNLAVALNDEMIKKCIQWLPDMVTLLPAHRNDSGEEGSLDLSGNLEYIEDVTTALRANNIVVNAVINADPQQVRSAARAGVDYVQLNTSILSGIDDLSTMTEQIEKFRTVAMAANKLGLGVAAGRGLDFQNIRELLDIGLVEEFNIGRSIVSRALLVGMERAVAEMKTLLKP
jgi:pyridoxine 5-phosphate synthase